MKALGGRLANWFDVEGGVAWLARLPRTSFAVAFLIGLLGAAVSLALRFGGQAFYGQVTGFMILLPGVILAALAGGRVAGLVAASASLAGGMWIVGARGGADLSTPLGQVAIINFVIVSVFCVLVASALRKTLARLDQSLMDLQASHARTDDTEHRLEIISEHAPVMLWMSEPDGKCAHLNRAQREFWDAPEDLDQFDFPATLHPEDRDRVLVATMEALMRQEPLTVEGRYRRHDGEWRVLLTDARPRVDRFGRFLGMIGVNTDVTEVRAAEAARRESEDQLRAMVDQAAAGIARIDGQGRVMSANRRFAEILGRSPEEVVGLTTGPVTHPDDIEPTLAMLRDVQSGGPGGQLEKRYLRPDGGVVWALTSIRALSRPDGVSDGYIAVVVDITDAKAAEAALRESESRFRLMADTAPSPVWLTNAEGAVEFVNAALVDFYGRPAEAILGHVWKQAVHPDDFERVVEAQAAARPSHLPYGFECRFQRADGAWRWMRVAVNPRFDADGLFLGYVGLAFDVTDQREAMEALAAQDRRQSFLLNLNDRLRDLSDPDRIVAEALRATGEMLGTDRLGYGEVQGDGETLVVPATYVRDDLADTSGQWRLQDFGPALIAQIAAGRVCRIEDVSADPLTRDSLEAFTPLGISANMSVPLMRAGELRAMMFAHSRKPRFWTDEEADLVQEVAARTWTEVERARAQAEVAESEARFRAIADTAPVLIWVTQQDRARAFVNQAYVAFNGGTYEEARLADWRAVLHPEDQERILKESLAGEATRQPFSMEARYLRHDGEYRWLKSFSRPRTGAGGEVIGFVGVAFDVTEARQAQEDLTRINELLEERVGEALAEKAKAEADLMHAQRMEAVGRLTGGVAHDFNNLLTVVIGALDLILRSPDDAERRTKLGEAALAAARRGERLTHQLLAFSRRQALRPEPIDLNGLIREGEPLLRRAVGEAVDFRIRLVRGGARVKVDPAQFEAALLNLVVNARDAVGDKGSITIQTRLCEAEAGEATELLPGRYVCVSVKDDGPGMDPAIAHRVFEPFFTTKPVGKGTGLGLSQVYGFARQSGGGVRIVTAPGEGTEVVLYLPPLEEGAAMVGEAQATRPPTAMAGGRVLLVEDDPGVAAVASELLAGIGLTVEMAESGPQALVALAARPFDLMVSDVVMPGGMTGVQLARQAAVLYPELRILLSSGYAGEDVDEALADAPWPFLRKPYSGEELAAAIRDLLAGRGASPA